MHTKKIILVLILFFAVVLAAAVNIFSRRAPDMLRNSIERALNKSVRIQEIDFKFPWSFELSGVEMRDAHGPFQGEPCFTVDHIHLVVSPLSLSQKDLIIDSVDVENATILIRKKDNRLYHALSDAMMVRQKPSATKETPIPTGERSSASLPLTLHRFHLTDGKFQFIDFDISPSGFVVALDHIQTTVQDIYLPVKEEKTFYRIDAQMPQGRDQKPAEIRLSGWTIFSNYDSDTLLSATGLHLPYFQPYLSQITPSQVQDGYLNNRSSIRVYKGDLTADADFELTGLYFSAYEGGEQLFGLKAEEILSFLKDASGRLKFQIIAQWNITDKNTQKHDVIRRAIEKSLKKTVLGNAGNLLEATLKKIGDHGLDASRDDWEGALKKVKEMFR